jgi:hypothetical protein
MEQILEWLQWGVPACMTFGPLFLVIEGRSARATRQLRYTGMLMVVWALGTTYLVTVAQRGRIATLEQRVELLERAAR